MTIALRALVIEDHPPDALLIRSAISRAGFSTDSVEEGARAIEAVEAADYHLILVDLCLPDIDGLQLVQALRGIDAGAKAKIICYSASDEREVINAALAHGADDFFTKGANKINLLETRFRGLAHKLRREEGTHMRLDRLEADMAEVKVTLQRVAANTEPVRDLGAAWDSTKGFVRFLSRTGELIDKTKYVWGPIVALIVWVKTGVLSWNLPKQ